MFFQYFFFILKYKGFSYYLCKSKSKILALKSGNFKSQFFPFTSFNLSIIFINVNKSIKSFQYSFQKGVWDFLSFDYLWKKH